MPIFILEMRPEISMQNKSSKYKIPYDPAVYAGVHEIFWYFDF